MFLFGVYYSVSGPFLFLQPGILFHLFLACPFYFLHHVPYTLVAKLFLKNIFMESIRSVFIFFSDFEPKMKWGGKINNF